MALSEHEVEVICLNCSKIVIVGGYIDDLPHPYTCLACRPLKDSTPTTAMQALAKARAKAGH